MASNSDMRKTAPMHSGLFQQDILHILRTSVVEFLQEQRRRWHAAGRLTSVANTANRISIRLPRNHRNVDQSDLLITVFFRLGQRDLFADYLLSKFLIECDNAVRKCVPMRLLMPWRDPLNSSDCGIYLMRHMETYMSTGLHNWCSSFKKRSEKQMRYLKAEYLKVILTCEADRRGKANVRLADAFLKASSRGCSINVEQLLPAAEPKKLSLED